MNWLLDRETNKMYEESIWNVMRAYNKLENEIY